MNCQFCYSKATRKELREECNIDDWRKFVDENWENIDSINYGTGENDILDDFFYFINYVRKNYPQIKQSLTTNGYISARIRENSEFYEIYKTAIDEVDVSIDYYIEEKHCEFRGQKNAFRWALDTLKISNLLNKLCTIVFVGYEQTLQKENIDGLFRLAKEYNALLRMNIYRPVSNNSEINSKFILSQKTLINALTYINEKYQIVSLSDVLLGSVYAGQNLKENTGVNSIRILPNGDICPSTYLISKEFRGKFNIKQGKILDRVKFPEFISSTIPKECKGCKYETECKGGVYDRRILWYGTLSQRDPYCPIRLGQSLPEKYFKVTKTSRVSVHDDYLPTLFFKNKD